MSSEVNAALSRLDRSASAFAGHIKRGRLDESTMEMAANIYSTSEEGGFDSELHDQAQGHARLAVSSMEALTVDCWHTV